MTICFLRNFERLVTLLKKEAQAHMFPREFCENFKNTFFTEHLWTTATVIRTAEYGILVIKKTSVKTLQILYSVFLNVPIKHVQEKEKRKEI